ncbi:MAG: glucose-6-phosphate isomerase [Burkholderiaceae bacterium]|nr:glucose-6-phosphate isomerase [Burkholderiaceae bacterium]
MRQPAPTPAITATASFQSLQTHSASLREVHLRQLFALDPARFSSMTVDAAGLLLDYSKNRVDATAMALLMDLARERGVEAQREAMFTGEKINLTEHRAVLHTALRAPRGTALVVDGQDIDADVQDVLQRMKAFTDRVRNGSWLGYTGKPICDIVNIGIGGSDLGPKMACLALRSYANPGLEMHFVSNVDGHDISTVLRRLKPAETLFIVASKTFTTQETMANAQLARAWFEAGGGTDIARHFVATTTNVEAAAAFGITTTFGFWDWVGGRFSLWSAIGLPIAVAIGADHFRELLAGAHAMDRHFAEAPLAANVPALLGLLDVWYRNFHGIASRSVAPYHHGLRRLPAYLQQLEMESNGKQVDRSGETLPFATSPVVWGEPGTNSQHAYFQMLHQGTDLIPVEFLLVRRPTFGSVGLTDDLVSRLERQQTLLLANGLAQSQALMCGKTAEQALADRPQPTSTQADAATLARHRTFSGNRPSTTLLLDRLTPHSLGALIALYEHRVFTSGALWGINSFDQWGVELGKVLCRDLLPRLVEGDTGAALDASTAGLIARLRG